MSWFSLALLSMFAKSFQNFAEKSSQKRLGSFLTMFVVLIFSEAMIAPYIFLTSSFPTVNTTFWIGIAGSVLIYLVAKPMRLFALGQGDISEIVPLISFSSLFSLIFGWIFLNEVPTNWGLLGVVLIVLGGYFMNYERQTTGFINKFTHPVKAVMKSSVQSYLFLSLILGSIVVVFDKLAINNTFPRSPHWVLFIENLFVIPALIPFLFLRKVKVHQLKNISVLKHPLILAIVFSVANLLNFSAIGVGNIGYVSAIRQLSSIVAVFGGYYFLKEGNLRRRVFSALIMSTGAFIIGYLG